MTLRRLVQFGIVVFLSACSNKIVPKPTQSGWVCTYKPWSISILSVKDTGSRIFPSPDAGYAYQAPEGKVVVAIKYKVVATERQALTLQRVALFLPNGQEGTAPWIMTKLGFEGAKGSPPYELEDALAFAIPTGVRPSVLQFGPCIFDLTAK